MLHRTFHRRHASWVAILAGALSILIGCGSREGSAPPAFKIYVDEPGVYRVTWDDLLALHERLDEIPSAGLAVTRRGDAVPIWVADDDDGRFGPGDWIELVGERLAGEGSHYDEHSRLNVYRLTAGGTPGLRMSSPTPPESGGGRDFLPLIEEQHHERDRLMERFVGRGVDSLEAWYWARLTHVDPEPFTQLPWLRNFRPDLGRPVALHIQLQGISKAARRLEGFADHRVEVRLNGELVGFGEWDGEQAHRIEIEVPDGLARVGENVLELRIPERRPAPAADPIIDAVMLNWIRIRYPRGPGIGDETMAFRVDDRTRDGRPVNRHRLASVRLEGALDARLTVYGAGGSRFGHDNMEIEDWQGRRAFDLYPPAQEALFYAVPEGRLSPPYAVELDHPSNLRDRERRADYVIITHPRLREPLAPLVDFHRRRGLEVAVVDVDDVYDEFSHSILDPRALRDFLSFAYHEWQKPAPRFVLLVGDAGWEPEKNLFASAAPVDDAERNLIPTGRFESIKGLAASDNFLVSVDGDDHLPDMAIGRFPATRPEEVAAIVAKTLRYATEPVVGPWRRQILWISSGDPFLQRRSDAAAAAVKKSAFDLRELYPDRTVASNEQSQGDLLQALGRGQLLVHFLGHGGRYIWRTGKTDYETKLDLFTVDHLDALEPTLRLPMVLSMTCHTSSFNHPTADSFAERMLRLDDRGAVAVLGASWKTSPVARYSKLLITELTAPGTIGEAIVRAKRKMRTRSLVELYNLLGDPALELARPALEVDLAVRDAAGPGWRIDATVPGGRFSGQAIVDWLDGAGEVVRSDELEVREAAFSAAWDAPAGGVEAVRVYVWSEDAGVDGMGVLELPGQPGGAVPAS